MTTFLTGLVLGIAVGYVFQERIAGFATMVASFIDRFDKEK